MTTRDQLIALRNQAKQAGDYRTADLCGQALAGDEDSVRECERVIASRDAGDPTALFDRADPAQREAADKVASLRSEYLGSPTCEEES